jgi:hypothetical protein
MRQQRYMPRISVVPTDDFQGGLNLNADPFQLRDNESPDVWNVDFDPLGGFKQRDGLSRIGASSADWAPPFNYPGLTSDPKSLWTYFDANHAQLLVQQGNRIFWTNNPSLGSIWFDVGASTAPWTSTTSGKMRAATFRDPVNFAQNACYIQRNAENAPVKWTGSGTGALLTDPATSTPAWNEDYAAPAKGKMPLARFISAHRDYVMVASTKEYEASSSGMVAHTSRVRWSHPGQPEDWRKNDWIDFEPGANDEITGIASWGDRLLIFKNNSVFELLGYDADSFEVVNLSRTIGALSQDAIAVCEQGVYFFSWPEGLHFFDGKQIHNLFYNLRPIMVDGTVQRSMRNSITVQWAKQRVWVSMPTDSEQENVNTVTYVFDPMLNGGRGAWTRYRFGDPGVGLGVGVEYQAPGGDVKWIAAFPYKAFGDEYSLVELHSTQWGVQVSWDYLDPRLTVTNAGGGAFPIVASYQTPWVDLGNPALTKAWRRPVFVCRADEPFTLECQGFRDYDDALPAGSAFQIAVAPTAAGGEWDASLWDGGDAWVANGNRRETIVKGARLGRAVSVCVKIEGPKTLADQAPWAVDSITWKYIPKRIRS